mmetsp:Transcript_107201/g.169256  ORF Transcript_107201/g.169256 Transcript_107201/m.169256 type:complete len:972 (+) Transcript_107201:60-2975(+)
MADTKESQAVEKAVEEKTEAKEETKDEPMEEVKEEAKAEEVKDEAMDEEKAEVKDEDADMKEEVKEEEEKEEEKEEVKEEEAKELEEDAPAETRKKVTASSVAWSSSDSTLNVLKVANGNILMSVTEGGSQYLLAGVRSTAGVKSGRYMLEVQILESLYPWEPQGSQGRTPAPKNLVRVGVSLAGSSLFLADTADSVCFDSEGYFFQGKKRSKVSQKFSKSHTVALLINLDEKSPNANTVSLFRDGSRISQPQKLPENLLGKALYPTITYKNVTVRVNLGASPLAALPFSCHMLSDAAAADVEIAAPPADGPCEVIFPVGLPDQGLFDYVDAFVEQHPKYTELSDRKILEWSNKSGIWRPKGYAQRSSNDKPDMNFGIPLMDDLSVNGVVQALAPAIKRDYIVNELRGNLLADERKKALARFSGPAFKRKAVVLMGEPPEDFKQKVQALMLAEKTAAAEADKRKKIAEDERNRLWEEKKKKAEEARKSRDKKNGAEEEEKKEDETMGTEENKEEEEEAKEEEAVVVELTDEEKKLWYRKSATPDLSQEHLGKFYASFTLPTTDEGFDDVSYVWQPKDKVETYLREWLLEQKRTQRAEHLEPSEWFKGEYEKWKKTLMEWKKKQNDFRDPVKRKYAQKKKEEEAKKAKEDAKKEEGETAEAEEKEEEKEAKPDITAEDVEVDTVEDVTDIGTGEPLFANFVYEDWTLVAMRYELHLLIHAFRKDLNDPDRPSFQETHLPYYYEKYYGKSFVLKNFGVEKMEDFLEMIEDSIVLAEGSSMLESKLAEDMALTQFIKLAEEHRRDRARRVDAGDETAQLKFKKPAPPPPRGPTRSDRGDDKGKSKGSSKGSDRRGSDKGKGGGSGGSSSRPTYSGSGGGSGGHSSAPPSRYGNSSRSDRDSYSRGGSGGGGGGGGGSSYGSEKRSYGSSSYPPPKQARTSSYSGGGGGGHGKADSRSSYSSSGGKGGSSSYYRR